MKNREKIRDSERLRRAKIMSAGEVWEDIEQVLETTEESSDAASWNKRVMAKKKSESERHFIARVRTELGGAKPKPT